MIEIAIVTTAVLPHKTRRDTDTDDAFEVRKGSIWVRRKEKIRRACLECLTPNGVRLELEAFFERFSGKSITVQVIQPKGFDETIAKAIVALVSAPVFDAPHSYKKFTGQRDRAGGAWRFTPFDYGFAGRAHNDFAPAWSVDPEPMILLKSSAGNGFTYPSTDDDEEDETADVRNGRKGGIKSSEKRKNT